MKVKRSVALAIHDPARPGMLLLVQRPHDDEDLPDVWGLPAATLTGDETPADAARRAGRNKLGLDLEIGAVLNEGAKQREAYRLEMHLLDARITGGSPDTAGRPEHPGTTGRPDNPGTTGRPDNPDTTGTPDNPDSTGTSATDGRAADGTTRYQSWRWGPVSDLTAAAAQGSLCSRLALEVTERG